MVALGASGALAAVKFESVQPIIRRINANQRLNKKDQVLLYNYQIKLVLSRLKAAWARHAAHGLGRVDLRSFAQECDAIREWSCVAGVGYLRAHCTNTLAWWPTPVPGVHKSNFTAPSR